MKLASGVMPPSNVGRKPKPLVPELTEALFEALAESVPESMEIEGRDTMLYPAFFGPDFSETAHVWEKDFQAQAEGRKYAKVLHPRVKKVVRVNVYHNGVVDSSGKPTEATRYTWRLYIPVTEFTDAEIAAASADENENENENDPASIDAESNTERDIEEKDLEPSNLD